MIKEKEESTKFDNSKNDKSNILEYKNIPKLRNKLESLKTKDRFQTVATSPTPMKENI